MTQKEKLEQVFEAVLQIEKKIVALEMNMRDGRKALVQEWRVYEDKYKKYLAKRDRFKNSLWWLFCKITFRNTKLTNKELRERTAKKMARIFYKKGL